MKLIKLINNNLITRTNETNPRKWALIDGIEGVQAQTGVFSLVSK